MSKHTERATGFAAGKSAKTRPDGVTNEHLTYLDDLRESGVTNMFGAGAYVADEFDVSDEEASKILGYWMESFGKPNR